ncbi:MAG: YkvA family protein [Actinomycetota bacterium]
MRTWFIVLLASLLLYCLFILLLLLVGRRRLARAVAGFIPDCLVLFKRLLMDSRVPRSRKLLIAVMVGYLATPIDVVPDFIPVAGQLDDAVLVAFVLRVLLKGGERDAIEQNWPGPRSSLNLLLKLAGAA